MPLREEVIITYGRSQERIRHSYWKTDLEMARRHQARSSATSKWEITALQNRHYLFEKSETMSVTRTS